MPVILNGAFVGAFSLAVGALILRVHLPASSLAPLALTVLIAAFSCTGLGLINGAVSLRIRENAVLNNVIFGFLLIFTGANVPLDALPGWMSTVAQGLPFTHAIEAARQLADGATLGEVKGLLGAELLIGAVYGIAGYAVMRWFEYQSRRACDAGAVLMRARDLNWLQVEEYLCARRPRRAADRLDRAARLPLARDRQHPRRARLGRGRRAARACWCCRCSPTG